MNIHILTDSGSDILNSDRSDLTVLPLSVTFGDTTYLDGATISHYEFFEKLIKSKELPTTSQIAPYQFEEAIREALKTADAVIIITVSGQLSGTFQSANIAASEFDGNVFVVDSMNVAVGERILVEQALALKDQGLDAAAIAEELNRLSGKIRTLAFLDTLEYLRKGGRISGAAALAGGMLHIKPIVTVKDGLVAMLTKARGAKQALNLLTEQVKAAGEIDFDKPYCLGYAGLSDETLRNYMEDNADLWDRPLAEVPVSSIGGAIGTHVGPGAIAVSFFVKP